MAYSRKVLNMVGCVGIVAFFISLGSLAAILRYELSAPHLPGQPGIEGWESVFHAALLLYPLSQLIGWVAAWASLSTISGKIACGLGALTLLVCFCDFVPLMGSGH